MLRCWPWAGLAPRAAVGAPPLPSSAPPSVQGKVGFCKATQGSGKRLAPCACAKTRVLAVLHRAHLRAARPVKGKKCMQACPRSSPHRMRGPFLTPSTPAGRAQSRTGTRPSSAALRWGRPRGRPSATGTWLHGRAPARAQRQAVLPTTVIHLAVAL